MKKITSQFFSVLALCLVLLISTYSNAQVGINTVTPAEMLDVNGNLKLDGAFMPGNAFGGVDQMLLSQGTNNPPVWGPGFINVSLITNIAKWFVTPFDISAGQRLRIIVPDADMTRSSTVAFNFVGPLPAPGPPGPGGIFWGDDFRVFVDPQDGQVVFYITNDSSYDVFNLRIALIAYYR